MDIIPEHIREEIATAEQERYSEMHTDIVRKAINSIPVYLVTPTMVADLSARPSKHSPVPAKRWGHHIGLLALLRSSSAHNSLLSICRARPRTGCAGDAAGRCDGEAQGLG